MSTVDEMIGRTLGHEGGYVNNPADPGGETNWGVSKRQYPHLDIKNLTREDAIAIYKRDYWDASHCDQMPDAIAFQVFDFAVNSGVQTALRKLQLAAGVADDGVWGPVTAGAVEEADSYMLILDYLDERLLYLERLKSWPTFGQGWRRRLALNAQYARNDLGQ